MRVARVSPNYFSLLGVQPAVGRTFSAVEADERQRVALISDSFWRARFHESDNAIGQSIVIDGHPSRIIGVMPRDFRFDDTEVGTPHVVSELGRSSARARCGFLVRDGKIAAERHGGAGSGGNDHDCRPACRRVARLGTAWHHCGSAERARHRFGNTAGAVDTDGRRLSGPADGGRQRRRSFSRTKRRTASGRLRSVQRSEPAALTSLVRRSSRASLLRSLRAP